MIRKIILSLAGVSEISAKITKWTLTLMKETCSPLMILVIFGGMFITAAIAQTSLQNKILTTAAQQTTDAATQREINGLIEDY